MVIAVYGSRADGHARVVIETLVQPAGHEIAGLIDDLDENRGHRIDEARVIATGGQLDAVRDAGVEGIVLGFGAARGRSAAIARIEESGLLAVSLVHPRAVVATSARLGCGVCVLASANVGPGAVLAAGALINTAANVEHDCRVGPGAVVAPGAHLLGRAKIGSDCEIGAGAIVLPDVSIGDRTIVGAGAVVTHDLQPDQTVVGTPAKPLLGPCSS